MSARAESRPPVRRYVRMERDVADGEARFWEVAVRERELWTRVGRVGSDGRELAREVFPEVSHALADAELRVVEKRQQGYHEVVHTVGEHARNHDIEAAILDDPDDPGGYLVYADWLQARGDPSGELIMLDHQYQRQSGDTRLLERALRRFEQKHRARLTPERLYQVQLASPKHTCTLERANGFVQRAHISRTAPVLPYTVRELMLALLHHPSCALLQELHIGAIVPAHAVAAQLEQGQDSGHDEYDYRPVIAALCQAAPVSLRRLVLVADHGSAPTLGHCHLGTVDALFRELPRLADLHLHAGTLEMNEIRAPSLERFQLSTPHPSELLLAAIDGATWPRLRELVLSGDDYVLDIGALPRLLAGDGVAALRSLVVTRTRCTGDILRALVASPLIARLETLDLSYGDLSDNDVLAMSERADVFRSLKHLVLDGNFISRSARADVRAVCPGVSVMHQRGAAADRPSFGWNDIVELAPDYRSIPAAQDVATSSNWLRVGVWGRLLWGQYQGREPYDVFVEVRAADDMTAGCTCPSNKVPCKHALGLLMLAESRRVLPVAEPSDGFVGEWRSGR